MTREGGRGKKYSFLDKSKDGVRHEAFDAAASITLASGKGLIGISSG